MFDILILMMDDNVPSKAREFLVSVLFSPIRENALSAAALE